MHTPYIKGLFSFSLLSFPLFSPAQGYISAFVLCLRCLDTTLLLYTSWPCDLGNELPSLQTETLLRPDLLLFEIPSPDIQTVRCLVPNLIPVCYTPVAPPLIPPSPHFPVGLSWCSHPRLLKFCFFFPLRDAESFIPRHAMLYTCTCAETLTTDGTTEKPFAKQSNITCGPRSLQTNLLQLIHSAKAWEYQPFPPAHQDRTPCD